MRSISSLVASIPTSLIVLAGLSMPAIAAAPLGAGLRELTASYDTDDTRLPQRLKLHITDTAGNPLVRIHLQPSADAGRTLAELAVAGFELQVRSTLNPLLVEGYLPLREVHRAAQVTGVHSILAQQRPARHVGAVTSQAVALEKVDLAQARGLDGRGLRIGALSDSYDACATCSTHAAQDIATGDLPAAGVTVLAGQGQGTPPNTDEGRAMLQLIHDIAPAAQLGFATAGLSELQFAENIVALRSQFGADVIVDDVIYPDEPMYSDGIVAQAVDAAYGMGAAYFSSAGNNGLEAFEDVYRPIPFQRALSGAGHGNLHLEQIPLALRPRSVHDFRSADGGVAITQRISVRGLNTLSFQWDEPFFRGRVRTDYNVYIFDRDGNWVDPATSPVVFYTTDDNLQTDEPFEFIALLPDPGDIVGAANVSDYRIVIGSMNDGPARHIKYVNINGLAVSERQNAPSTFGHATARGAQGVAATYYALPQFPEDFSSPGPVTIYLDPQGNRLRRPQRRLTPQLTAADGVDTTFFGSDTDGDGWPNFFGTSAAAPDAAAVAALVLQFAGGPGSLTPRQVYRRLQRTATPLWTPDVRWVAGAFAGPLAFSINADWTRWHDDFSVAVGSLPAGRSIVSLTLDVSGVGLAFNPNINRFSVDAAQGVAAADLIPGVSADAKRFTISAAPGSLQGGASFNFGLSVFAPIQGSTQEDPDRFRGMRITVTLDDGRSFSAPVQAMPKVRHSNFTGFGLVNADAATRDADDGSEED